MIWVFQGIKRVFQASRDFMRSWEHFRGEFQEVLGEIQGISMVFRRMTGTFNGISWGCRVFQESFRECFKLLQGV